MTVMKLSQKFALADVLEEVRCERLRQHEKWGEQSHPDGTGPNPHRIPWAATAQSVTDHNAKTGALTFADILLEEVCEVLEETDPAKLRAELVQVAAVAVQWIEAIDRRRRG